MTNDNFEVFLNKDLDEFRSEMREILEFNDKGAVEMALINLYTSHRECVIDETFDNTVKELY